MGLCGSSNKDTADPPPLEKVIEPKPQERRSLSPIATSPKAPADKSPSVRSPSADDGPTSKSDPKPTEETPQPSLSGKRKRWKDHDEPLSLLDVLQIGPPPIKDQVEEVIENLEEVLEDLNNGKLHKNILRNRLNESLYVLTHLKFPQEAVEDRGTRLAAFYSSKGVSGEVAGDKDVQAWMKTQFNPQKPKPSISRNTIRGSSISEQKVAKIAEKFVNRLRLMSRTHRVLALTRRLHMTEEEKEKVEKALTPLERIEFHLVGFTTRFILRITEQWGFDVFRLSDCTHGHPLTVIMVHLFEKLDLFHQFNLSKVVFARFIQEIENGYNDVPYHNKIHAADVVQNTYYFLSSATIRPKLTPEDWFAALIAAAVHDFNHPGTNNAYHVATESDLAVEYNDQSVLENMHVSRTFQIMRKEGFGILNGVDRKIRSAIRSTMISLVLATDMKYHFGELATLQTRVAEEKKKLDEDKKDEEKGSSQYLKVESKESKESKSDHKIDNPKTMFSPPSKEDRLLLMKTAVHCADLGNPAKPQPTMRRWTAAITEEFFLQGDYELALGLPVSPMMDRTKPTIEKSQIGFIDFIVFPLYRTLATIIPETVTLCVEYLEANKQFWLKALKDLETPQPLRLPGVSPVVDHKAQDAEKKKQQEEQLKNSLHVQTSMTSMTSVRSQRGSQENKNGSLDNKKNSVSGGKNESVENGESSSSQQSHEPQKE